MGAEVDFQEKEGYVFVEITGSSDKSDLLSVFEKILIYSTVQKASKMLVDCRGIETVMPLEEIAAVSDKFNNIQTDYEGLSKIDITFAFLINEKLHDLSQINSMIDTDVDQPSFLSGNYEETEKWLLSK